MRTIIPNQLFFRFCYYIQSHPDTVFVQPSSIYNYRQTFSGEWEMIHSSGGWLMEIDWTIYSLDVISGLSKGQASPRYILSANDWQREFSTRVISQSTDFWQQYVKIQSDDSNYMKPHALYSRDRLLALSYDNISHVDRMERDLVLARFGTPSWVWNYDERVPF